MYNKILLNQTYEYLISVDDSPISRVGFVPEHGISLKDFKRRMIF